MSREMLEKELFNELGALRNAVTEAEQMERLKRYQRLEGFIIGLDSKDQHSGKSKYDDPDWIAKRASYNSYTKKLTPEEEEKEKAELIELIKSVNVPRKPLKDDATIMAIQFGQEVDESGEFISDDRTEEFPRTSILDKFVYVEPTNTETLEKTQSERVI